MAPNTIRENLPYFAAALLALSGCSTSSGGGDEPVLCEGEKCDDPGSAADAECREECDGDSACVQTCRDDAAQMHCELRRSDALDSAQQAFTPDAIRWACADVEGVNTNGRDDRGQEYCEYYASVQLPPETEGGELPDVETPGKQEDFGSTAPLSLELTDDQIFALEDEPDAVVGQCVFTSWHSDIDQILPICGGSEFDCPTIQLPEDARLPSWFESANYNLPLTARYMKMKGSINSNNAAADLFEKCLVEPPVGDPENADDFLHDEYMRGCWKSYTLFKTEWRRSDPSVCAAGVRVAECGCGVDTDADGVADITDPVEVSRALVPFQPDADGTLRLRGFHLGTWSDMNELPVGCRYLDTGDEHSTKTLVSCDLTATDILNSQSDPKGKCREKYGDNVVIHVPVPKEAIVCAPPEDGQYSDSCTDMPWVLTSEAPPSAE